MNYREYYENVSAQLSFWDLPRNSPRYYQDMLRYDVITAIMPKSAKKILDIGCGDGYLSYMLAKRGKQTISVDFSMNRLKKLDRISNSNEILRIQTDATQLGLVSGTFDAVICSEVIEHIEDFMAVLKEAYRTLQTGGTLIVTVPNKERIKHIICPHCQKSFNQDGHLHHFDKESLSAALMEAGFKVTRSKTFRHRLLNHLQYHTKMKYGFFLRNLDRLFSTLTREFTWYLLTAGQK